MWHKVAEPSVNLKSSKGGDRGTISGGPSRYSRYAIIVDADYQAREFIRASAATFAHLASCTPLND